MKRVVIFITLCYSSIISCSYDQQMSYYSQSDCDTMNVFYSLHIEPIIQRNCIECHFTGNELGITLDTYEGIKPYAESGTLLGVVKHLDGYLPMPEDGKLDDCSIAKIEVWINNGAKNN